MRLAEIDDDRSISRHYARVRQACRSLHLARQFLGLCHLSRTVQDPSIPDDNNEGFIIMVGPERPHVDFGNIEFYGFMVEARSGYRLLRHWTAN